MSSPLSPFAVWMLAVRPKTLSLSAAPVLVGAALSLHLGGGVYWPSLLAALLGALFIQVATNLHNDAVDFEKGADGPERLGPPRVTALGLVPVCAVKRAAWGCFLLAALAGLFLVLRGGWPILLLGLASIAAGWAYTGGRWPISHSPLGELFVLAFFGIGAVAGTVWLQMSQLPLAAMTCGVAMGLFAAAVLLVNNHRDASEDARNGRRTLAILAGEKGARRIYAALMLAPFVLLAALHWLMPWAEVWPAVGALPLAWKLIRAFPLAAGRDFNLILARTAQTQLLYGVLLSLGLSLS
ncbi:MAG TPA: 1,4-dihydroxy-2-naphthoate octaprenyltransferase [Candidatus Sulfotelmatobacter sp.]|nr:1,4-dihydroxy-2-naphthoate octaprenyltransferase [Candidatus Sulfotelmatobacter sp.]